MKTSLSIGWMLGTVFTLICNTCVLDASPLTPNSTDHRWSAANTMVKTDKEIAPVQSCAVDLSGVTEPLTADGLITLMTQYALTTTCNNKLRAALDSIFLTESRNDQWASELERVIGKVGAAGGVRVTGECHASLCRYDIELTQPNQEMPPYEIDRRIIASVKDSKLAVDSIHFGSPLRHQSYFYSTVLPAAFVEPLRRRMEGGQ